MGRVPNRGLHFFATVTACATFFLIIAGALVTSNDAGLSVPDWPLSYGQLMPEMVGGIFYEHGHRMIASLVGLLTIILNLWLWRAESRRWVRGLGLIALGAVIAQGLLGGMTVLFFLPTSISVLHATLAQVFFCLTVILAVVTSPDWGDSPRPPREGWGNLLRYGSPTRPAVLVNLAIFGQLILGATLRHSGTLHGTKGATVVTSLLLAHLAGALVVTSLIVLAATALTRMPDRRIARFRYPMLVLLAGQLLLGLGAYLERIDPVNRVQPSLGKVVVTVSHVGLGALLLAISLFLTLKIIRHTVLRGEGAVSDPALAGQVL